MEARQMPTSEDVMKKMKDDGDFDALRLKIIRAVKENEELRTNIINQVKQSDILNHEKSEDMKPRQLSDAIYQELGRKIIGQISDELWKVIRSNDRIKNDISATVEQVFGKMVSAEPHGNIREANDVNTSTTTPKRESNKLSPNEINEPQGFSSSGQRSNQSQSSELEQNEQRSEPFIQNEALMPDDDSDLPPGFS